MKSNHHLLGYLVSMCAFWVFLVSKSLLRSSIKLLLLFLFVCVVVYVIFVVVYVVVDVGVVLVAIVNL